MGHRPERRRSPSRREGSRRLRPPDSGDSTFLLEEIRTYYEGVAAGRRAHRTRSSRLTNRPTTWRSHGHSGYPPIGNRLCSLPDRLCDPMSPASVWGRSLSLPAARPARWRRSDGRCSRQLAERFADVAIVGTPDDLRDRDGRAVTFPPHARSFVGSPVASTDGGADGGRWRCRGQRCRPRPRCGRRRDPHRHAVWSDRPSMSRTLPDNVTVMRAGLSCEPCWTSSPLAAARAECRASRGCRSTMWSSADSLKTDAATHAASWPTVRARPDQRRSHEDLAHSFNRRASP